MKALVDTDKWYVVRDRTESGGDIPQYVIVRETDAPSAAARFEEEYGENPLHARDVHGPREIIEKYQISEYATYERALTAVVGVEHQEAIGKSRMVLSPAHIVETDFEVMP